MLKHFYAKKFALPQSQIRFLSELTEKELDDVRRYFSSTLVNCEKYVYAVKRSGGLVWARHNRDMLEEQS